MGNFNHLPTDIILDILTRLPTQSVLDCKLVCKPWRNLVSHHPSFYRMHLTHINHSPDSSGKLSFLVLDDNRKLHYFEYNEEHDETIFDSIRRIIFTPPFTHSYNVIGSHNGLVCLYGRQDSAYCVCNPATREYFMLPKINKSDQYIHSSSGFGYDSLSNEYKVVETYELWGEETNLITEVSVYTLGSHFGWRNVVYAEPGIFANGMHQWGDRRSGETLLAFYLTEEKFREHLSPPPFPLENRGVVWPYNTLGESGGVSYYSIMQLDALIGTRIDVWLVKKKNDVPDKKEQVEHEPLGWSKEVTKRVPLTFTRSGTVLCSSCLSISVYDPIASTLKKLVEFIASNQIIPYKSTLVSLKELEKDGTRIMELAEREEA